MPFIRKHLKLHPFEIYSMISIQGAINWSILVRAVFTRYLLTNLYSWLMHKRYRWRTLRRLAIYIVFFLLQSEQIIWCDNHSIIQEHYTNHLLKRVQTNSCNHSRKLLKKKRRKLIQSLRSILKIIKILKSLKPSQEYN